MAPSPSPTDDHVCKPGATVYYCPASGETESDCHGGFDQCCDRPDEHRPVSTVLRDHLAAALLARIKQAVVPKPLLFGSPPGSLFAATERDLADTALGALTDYLDIGEAEAWCTVCRRVWDGRNHRCDSEADQCITRVREALAQFDDRGVLRHGSVNLDVPTAGEVINAVRAALDKPIREQRERPTHADGTPYRYSEIVAEGWGYCDGCGLWSTGTPRRPHRCAQDLNQGGA